MKTIRLGLLIIFLAGCQSRPGAPPAAPPNSVVIETAPLRWPFPLEESENIKTSSPALFSQGRCLPGAVSADSQVLLLSCTQPTHTNWEIYSYRFETNRLRRITHHDNDARSPIFVSASEFLYTSATDEVKERSEIFIEELKEKYLRKAPSSGESENGFLRFFPGEVYATDLQAAGIQRLTRTDGHDGDLSFEPQKQEVYFSSRRSGDSEIYKMSRRGRGLVRLTETPGFDGQVQVSAKAKKMVWVHLKEATTELRIADMNGKNPRTLPLEAGFHWMPAWHPQGEWLVFSSNIHDKNRFALYAVKPDGHCLQKISEDESFDISPVFRPEGKSVIFARWKRPHLEVVEVPFSPAETCTDR